MIGKGRKDGVYIEKITRILIWALPKNKKKCSDLDGLFHDDLFAYHVMDKSVKHVSTRHIVLLSIEKMFPIMWIGSHSDGLSLHIHPNSDHKTIYFYVIPT